VRRHRFDPSDMSRQVTLPSHPAFIAPAFRSVPRWLRIKGWVLALWLMGITSVLSVVNIVLMALMALMAKSGSCS
jgi:hypothetical protein